MLSEFASNSEKAQDFLSECQEISAPPSPPLNRNKYWKQEHLIGAFKLTWLSSEMKLRGKELHQVIEEK